MTINKLIYFDRSRSTKDWYCPRSRFYQYEYNGRGIVSNNMSLALSTGLAVHDSLAAIAFSHQAGEAVDIDLIATTAFKQMFEEMTSGKENDYDAVEYAREQATLTEGMIRGFYKQVWPRLLSLYPTIVAVEKEVTFDLGDGLVFMSKPDLILEDRDGEWHYLEYKTTSSKKAEWVESWETAVQVHSSIKAVESTLGKAPIDVTIVGLYKGYVSYDKQNSPFCYAYTKSGNPPFTQDQISYEYRSGFKRTPIWEMKGGVKAWVENMPDEILANQFPMTPPILVDQDLVDAFFAQREIREKDIKLATVALGRSGDDATNWEILNKYFPQRFENCRPAYGYSCEYRKLCFGSIDDPLSHGFEYREPHHGPEMEAMGLVSE